MKLFSQMKRPGATVAGIFSLALGSVVLLCGAGSVPVENFTPQGPMQADLNAGGHNLTNIATVSATNLVISGTLTAANLGSAATNAASAFAPASGPFPWSGVSGAPAIQVPITLSTSGTSGAATFSSGTLNIPQYAGAIYSAGSGLSLNTGTFTNTGVLSFNTRTGAVTLQASDLAISGAALTAVPSSTSLYPTLNQNTTGTATYALNVPWSGVSGAPAFQVPITLTTSGTSGAATFSSGTLNIPQYVGATYAAGPGLALNSGTFTNTGVLSFNSRTGTVTLRASDLALSGTNASVGAANLGQPAMVGPMGPYTLAQLGDSIQEGAIHLRVVAGGSDGRGGDAGL
jgi:hypothetical protein